VSLYDPAYRQASAARRVSMTLLRLGQAARKLAMAEAEPAGLTPVQAQTVLFIRHTKSFLTTVGKLAQHLGTTHVTAVGVVQGLERRGLVRRVQPAWDRRTSLLRLTPAGEAACDRLDQWGHALAAALAALPPQDLEHLERGLGAVVRAFQQAGLLTVAEPCRGCVHFRENVAPGSAEPHRCALVQRFLSESEARRNCPDHTPALAAAAD